MKVIIAGSRTIDDYNVVQMAIYESNFIIQEVVSGGANGVDKLGEKYANESRIPIKIFQAMWKISGRKAGFLRNLEMAKYADALIAIWDGESKGTKNMIDLAKNYGLKVFIKEYKKEEVNGSN